MGNLLINEIQDMVEGSTSRLPKAGMLVPSVTFKVRVRDETIPGPNPFKWKDVTSDMLFKGKRVIVFGLPGAFTPTCSNSHLPGYEAKYEEFLSHGIQEIYCISVNDAFVMRQWGLNIGLTEEEKDNKNPLNPGNFKNVKLLPDGNGHFTRGMGMMCSFENKGFGSRSWRYSCIIKNGVIEKIFIESGAAKHDSDIDPFLVTDAATMLSYLKNPATYSVVKK